MRDESSKKSNPNGRRTQKSAHKRAEREPKSEEKKKVISEPVKLDQKYRDFDFESPWEGTEYIKLEEKENKTKEN